MTWAPFNEKVGKAENSHVNNNKWPSFLMHLPFYQPFIRFVKLGWSTSPCICGFLSLAYRQLSFLPLNIHQFFYFLFIREGSRSLKSIKSCNELIISIQSIIECMQKKKYMAVSKYDKRWVAKRTHLLTLTCHTQPKSGLHHQYVGSQSKNSWPTVQILVSMGWPVETTIPL